MPAHVAEHVPNAELHAKMAVGVKVFDMIPGFRYGLLFTIYFIFTDSSVLLTMRVWLRYRCFVTYMNVRRLLIVTDSTTTTSVRFLVLRCKSLPYFIYLYYTNCTVVLPSSRLGTVTQYKYVFSS